jgi:GNAT superfamily N-acetyltransferase
VNVPIQTTIKFVKIKVASTPDISRIQLKTVKVTFLEMHKAPEEKIAARNEIHFSLLTKPINVETYRHYYYGVGEKYFWLDRMLMEDEKLSRLINDSHIDIIVMYVNNEAAGYAEFKKEEKFTEIVYFGLLPAFIAKGLGKYFLDWVIQQAWSYKPEWIRLDTCELDHPHALFNYKKRGFTEVRTEIQDRKVII